MSNNKEKKSIVKLHFLLNKQYEKSKLQTILDNIYDYAKEKDSDKVLEISSDTNYRNMQESDKTKYLEQYDSVKGNVLDFDRIFSKLLDNKITLFLLTDINLDKKKILEYIKEKDITINILRLTKDKKENVISDKIKYFYLDIDNLNFDNVLKSL
jgi:hypothetical protein